MPVRSARISAPRSSKLTAEARPQAAISVSKDSSALAIEGGSGTGSGIVLLIGFDRDHQTAIRRGENGGRTLEEANVVRSIRTIGAWQGETLRLTENGEDVAVLLETQDGRMAARL